ncbi:MAG: UvrD-helicase domain-containing protein, partial [Treponema sp.]|nr:UvrD-helicase domain-containing protein [Treponema sp.]
MNSTAETFSFIQTLDEEQRAAAVTEENAVVSAGAGSGKTTVLTARFGWLIMTGRCELDQILTITFTNKAANEMYRRIYSLLSAHAISNSYARKAVEQFHKARISTLDSFCSGVARTVCRRFGISPDFKSDTAKLKELARSLALRFVLDHRNNPSLANLITEKNIRHIAEDIFVKPLLLQSTVSTPLNFNLFEKIQKEEILKRWNDLSRRTEELFSLIREYLKDFPSEIKRAPDIGPLLEDNGTSKPLRDEVVSYINFLSDLTSFRFKVGKKTDTDLIARESLAELKDLYGILEALANSAFQWSQVTAVFPLIAEFEEIFNLIKQESGILGFYDIARLAVDGLRQFEDIRSMYRESFRMIMIDEFQDNNSLQRDLVDLLTGPARVFYVGDEKQSIYRFRGADVSVFRSLAEQTEGSFNLNTNYRSHPSLVEAFNRIFGGCLIEDESDSFLGIFPPAGTKTENYQAVYRKMKSREDPAELSTRLHFAFFDKGSIKNSGSNLGSPDLKDFFSAEDIEAIYIAGKIQDMYIQKIPVNNHGNKQPCTYNDFAVLLRSHTHQDSLERAFKLYGIPFSADRPAGLFNDAALNDLWIFLKLLVYPDDRIAYASHLRSPFVRLSEDAFTLCMLEMTGKIFDESLDEKLKPEDRQRYREARRRYEEILTEARDLSVCSLITRLWYKEGYRQEALWSQSAQAYLSLYDLFFEQAEIIEKRGGSLVYFLDYLDDLENRQEKPDDSTLPDEEGSGVRIMTIHRSKGLEFPFVFVYGCGSTEKTSPDTGSAGLACFSERFGVILRLQPSEEFPDAGDYFFQEEKKDHRNKSEAELRRLLYVAMTRAEQELFLTAVIPAQNKKEREVLSPDMHGGYGKQYIIERLEQFRTKPDLQSISFLRLLPDISKENSLYTIEAIDIQQKVQYKKDFSPEGNLRQAMPDTATRLSAGRLLPDYQSIPAVPLCRSFPQTIHASGLHADITNSLSTTIPGFEALDKLFRQTKTGADEFGIMVHSFIEAAFNNEKPKLPFRFSAAVNDEKLS